ncbi:MAG: helix-turn-helix transcriptional regulator [Cyanobacteria bacterium P01_F01_bin.150]
MSAESMASSIATKSFPGSRELKRGAWSVQRLPQEKGEAEFKICHLCSEISCTISDCIFTEPFHNCIPYSQPVTLLVFGLKGFSHFSFSDGGRDCVVREGDVWLIHTVSQSIFRHTPAAVRSSMVVLKYCSMRINDAFTESEEIHQFLAKSHLLRLARQQRLDARVESILRNQMVSASARLLAEAKALELLAHWITSSADFNVNQQGMSVEGHTESSELDAVIEKLISDLTKPPSLRDLAKEAGISHTCLNRRFRKHFGMTVFEWLRLHRLERAQRYLQDQERSITDIAFQCGFSSASHFGQCFKKQFGQSPTDYRQSFLTAHRVNAQEIKHGVCVSSHLGLCR